jgi:hypothetical protein
VPEVCLDLVEVHRTIGDEIIETLHERRLGEAGQRLDRGLLEASVGLSVVGRAGDGKRTKLGQALCLERQ